MEGDSAVDPFVVCLQMAFVVCLQMALRASGCMQDKMALVTFVFVALTQGNLMVLWC